MGVFIARRLGAAVLMLLAISLLTFLMLFPATADVARNVLGEGATEEQVAVLRERLGLDQPAIVQFGSWVADLARGDLGASYFTSQPVAASLAVRIPVTLSVLCLVIVLTGLIGLALGLWAGYRRGVVDRVLVVVVTLGEALPAFILALLLVTVFALGAGWFPATGYVAPTQSVGGWLWALVLPVTALTVLGVAGVAQQVRNSVIGVLRQDFVRTLRARGLSERRILFTNVLRNASGNGLTALAVQVVGILGGSIIIEQIFALPGLGSFVVQSTVRTDIPVILAVVMTYVLIVLAVNLLVDLVVASLNPKVRLT